LWAVSRASCRPMPLSLQSMSPRASYRGGTRGKPSGRRRACEGSRGIRVQLRPRTPERRPFAQLATAPECSLLIRREYVVSKSFKQIWEYISGTRERVWKKTTTRSAEVEAVVGRV
jgi:hypothetical protein